MRVSVCLGAFLIPEYLDFYPSYSAPRSRIAGINSGIYSYSGISQTNAPLVTHRVPFNLHIDLGYEGRSSSKINKRKNTENKLN